MTPFCLLLCVRAWSRRPANVLALPPEFSLAGLHLAFHWTRGFDMSCSIFVMFLNFFFSHSFLNCVFLKMSFFDCDLLSPLLFLSVSSWNLVWIRVGWKQFWWVVLFDMWPGFVKIEFFAKHFSIFLCFIHMIFLKVHKYKIYPYNKKNQHIKVRYQIKTCVCKDWKKSVKNCGSLSLLKVLKS